MDKIIKQLYEDKVNKIISQKRFEILLKDFEGEYSITESKISNITNSISSMNNRILNISQWLDVISQYDNITALTRETLDELIEKIVVNEISTSDNQKRAVVSIYYHLIGTIDKKAFDKL